MMLVRRRFQLLRQLQLMLRTMLVMSLILLLLSVRQFDVTFVRPLRLAVWTCSELFKR